jgi:hypothetical protein
MTTVLNIYATKEATLHPSMYKGVKFTPGKTEYFPIPQQQIDAENSLGTINLKQLPGY